jgi:Chromo (CHRromatin Organisation MOdifier) domain
MAAYANKRRRPEEHQVDDLVLLPTKLFKSTSDSSRARKLAPKFAGPYKVIKRVSPVAYRLELPPARMLIPSFTLPSSRRIRQTLLVNGRPSCLRLGLLKVKWSMVDAILDERVRRGKKEYFVYWAGYHTNDSTWDPVTNVLGSEALMSYQESSGRGGVL